MGGLHFLSLTVIDSDGNEELLEKRENKGFLDFSVRIAAVFGIVHKPALARELPKETVLEMIS